MDLIPFPVSENSLEAYLINITTRSRIIYWIIMIMIIMCLILLPFIYVDVSIQAHGYFQANLEKQIVYTTFQGRVIYSSISSGRTVNKGDTLLIIDAEAIEAQRASLAERIKENDYSIIDLERLTKIDLRSDRLPQPGLLTLRYNAEYENLRHQQAIQYQKYQKKKTENDRNEILFHQQIIPEAEFETSIFQLNSEKEILNQILLSQRTLWQNDLTSRRNESTRLSAELKQYSEEMTNRIITAPTNGEIIMSSDIQEGSLVSAGQHIADISPEGELVATCFVKPAEVGLIHEKQKVRIQVDAYNYNEWGMIQGDIIDISDDMLVENGSEAYFRIKCKPEKTFLTLKNGYRADIKKGMSINTRIIVIRRDLFHLLFDKADKWFNPYSYPKKL
jgi:membrane fusion protein, peptide pheromone/bacteriocin exporter